MSFPFCLSSCTSCSLKLALRSSQLTRVTLPPPPVLKEQCNPTPFHQSIFFFLHFPPFLFSLYFLVCINLCYNCLLSFLFPTFLPFWRYFWLFLHSLCSYSFSYPVVIFLSSCPFHFSSFLPCPLSWHCVFVSLLLCLLFPCRPVLYLVLPCVLVLRKAAPCVLYWYSLFLAQEFAAFPVPVPGPEDDLHPPLPSLPTWQLFRYFAGNLMLPSLFFLAPFPFLCYIYQGILIFSFKNTH